MGYNFEIRPLDENGEISTHVPRVGYNEADATITQSTLPFQLTYPVWGTTHDYPFIGRDIFISTHVPRVGYNQKHRQKRKSLSISTHVPRVGYNGDCNQRQFRTIHFNSRTPCGVQPDCRIALLCRLHFNSRTPCGVQPQDMVYKKYIYTISINLNMNIK